VLSARATAARVSALCTLRSVPFGKYWRSRVLVRGALPGTVRIAKVDRDAGVNPQAGVLRHLGSLIPGQRATKLRGQRDDGARNGVADRFRTMAASGGPFFRRAPRPDRPYPAGGAAA
jgi:hypothetical protein